VPGPGSNDFASFLWDQNVYLSQKKNRENVNDEKSTMDGCHFRQIFGRHGPLPLDPLVSRGKAAGRVSLSGSVTVKGTKSLPSRKQKACATLIYYLYFVSQFLLQSDELFRNNLLFYSLQVTLHYALDRAEVLNERIIIIIIIIIRFVKRQNVYQPMSLSTGMQVSTITSCSYKVSK